MSKARSGRSEAVKASKKVTRRRSPRSRTASPVSPRKRGGGDTFVDLKGTKTLGGIGPAIEKPLLIAEDADGGDTGCESEIPVLLTDDPYEALVKGYANERARLDHRVRAPIFHLGIGSLIVPRISISWALVRLAIAVGRKAVKVEWRSGERQLGGRGKDAGWHRPLRQTEQ